MRLLLSCCLLLVSAGLANAQQTISDPNAQVRTVEAFSSIAVSSGIDLYLTPGETETVVVSASEDKYRDKIITKVENGVLKIYYDWKNNIQINWNSRRVMKAYVSYKTLEKLSAGGGSDVFVVNGTIKQTNLNVSLSGGSDFKGRLEVDKLVFAQSGGSDSDISGTAKTASISISGGSDMDAYSLTVADCTVNASGGSDVSVTVTNKLTASASGGSDISYKGDCELAKSASGGGSVKKRS
jgi:hypothetical protein